MRVKDWPELSRPKEKALLYGVDKISDEEILAIIINSGIKNHSSYDIARTLLKNGIRSLGKMNYQCLIEITGIGQHKALVLNCIFELLKRYEKSKAVQKIKFNSSYEIVEHIKFGYSLENEEKVMLLILDTHNSLIKEIEIAKGHHNYVQIDMTLLFKLVIKNECTRFIIVHNHPDGEVNPSKEDIISTEEISKRAKVIGLKLVDHIIVTKDEYFSFLDHHII